MSMLDVKLIKKQFPIFSNRKKLVYLDSAATTLKPKSVIAKMNGYYEKYSANIFRGIYEISERATLEYEKTRVSVSGFIKAKPEEIVFVRNATEAINLTVYGLSEMISAGDEILVTIAEHHANFVPWQTLARKKNAVLKILDIDDSGIIDPVTVSKAVSSKTKIFAFTAVSNVFGVENSVKKIIEAARKKNRDVVIVVDAAQAAPSQKIDTGLWDADFIAFSAHKMLGPTGLGVLWGKYRRLDEMPPFETGGEMIEWVTRKSSGFKKPPHRFEAGTPAIAETIGFAESVRFIDSIEPEKIRRHEIALARYGKEELKKAFGNGIIFYSQNLDSSLITFNLLGVHSHDVAQIMAEDDIAVRAGHHCAQPLHEYLGINSSVRASFYVYNDERDVDSLVRSLLKARKLVASD